MWSRSTHSDYRDGLADEIHLTNTWELVIGEEIATVSDRLMP